MSLAREISRPSSPTITSPARRPAAAAAPSGRTSFTSAPRGRGSLNASASVWSTSCTETPMLPCAARPVRTIWPAMERARSIGIAKASPCEPPDPLKICELMPTTWPRALKSGPPELPGLIAASVWMKGKAFSPGSARVVALTTPAVTVFSKP